MAGIAATKTLHNELRSRQLQGHRGTAADWRGRLRTVVRNSRGMDISDSPLLRYDDYVAALNGVESLSKSLQEAGQPYISVCNALTRNG